MHHDSRKIILILWDLYFAIETLLFYLLLPISFSVFHILNDFHIINEIYVDGLSKNYYRISRIFNPEKNNSEIRRITFMIPYVKFVSYPQRYDWWLELIKPQPSPFVETINREIYKTCNGEALINFKWNSYGKYYYAINWLMFNALLGCFTASASFPNDYISQENRKRLFLTASFILGYANIFHKCRQLVYDPIGWYIDPWNYFGKKKFNLLQMLLSILICINIYIFFRSWSLSNSYLYIYLLVIYQ